MYKAIWDTETGGVTLQNYKSDETLSVSPRPVFYEELDLLGLDKLPDGKAWHYPHCKEPLLWACNKQYYYKGQFVFEAKGANLYDSAIIQLQPGAEGLTLNPVNVKEMLERCKDAMFHIESEAIEFIRSTYEQYSRNKLIREKALANQIDFEALAAKVEKSQKKKMAIVKEDCESFDIMPIDQAKDSGKQIYQTTAKIDVFLTSFSGGKDSQVVLDLCTRALPPEAFQVIYSDTGYELPTSLSLYREVQRYYHKKYPTLQFRLAKNHESVLNYWDQIGTPSDTHRWCCTIMKTAPLYRMLKVEGTNKQAKVLAFEGTRGEESVKRSTYERIGKGVKHNGVINARPIYSWSTIEVFLYLIGNDLPINNAYRLGKPRVGCLICPFSSEWDDMIVNHCFPKELSPFLTRIEDWAKSRNIPNLEEYIKGHKWKLRASGKFLKVPRKVSFIADRMNVKGSADNPSLPIDTWLPILGKCVTAKNGNTTSGELRHRDQIHTFEIQYKEDKSCEFIIRNLSDPIFAGLIKRAIYKSVYCINCESCEVECPTGALSVYPKISISTSKCIHCYKCLNFHNKGCVVADSIDMVQTEKTKLTGISGYGTFGLREEWLTEYLLNKDDFWKDNTLGNKQVDSMKAWLKDAGIIDSSYRITPFGEYIADIKDDFPDSIWEIIWINLSYKSPLIKWFNENAPVEAIYSKAIFKAIYESQYQEGLTTFAYSLDALFNFLASSPIGTDFNQKIDLSKLEAKRGGYNDITDCGVLYSLYKYAQSQDVYTFRVSDLYSQAATIGLKSEFGTSRQSFEKMLHSLNSNSKGMVIAELNMGLDHIILKNNLDPFDALKAYINF